MDAIFSPLTDKLPPEIRRIILEDVLRCDCAVFRAHDQYPDERLADTSLFTVCKSIYLEASAIFYELNTISLYEDWKLSPDIEDRDRWHMFVRRLELVNIDDDIWLTTLATNIELAKSLPRLQRLTVAWDALDLEDCDIVTFLKFDNLHEGVRFVDVGLLELANGDDRSFTVTLKHYGMAEAWKHVKRVGAVDASWRLHESYAGSWTNFFEKLYLPDFCVLYDLWLAPYWPTNSRFHKILIAFGRRFRLQGIAYMPPGLPAGTPLRDIDAAKHGEDSVQWLTEVLGMNAKRFPSMVAYGTYVRNYGDHDV